MTLFHRWISPATCAIAIFAFIGSAIPVQSQDNTANLTIILDSSRSMWGQIAGVNKVVSVRNVLGQISKQYEGRVDLGLVSYGHRQASSCTDIEVLLPPGPHKASKFAKTASSIKPKGSTPIAASLEAAAKAAKFTKRRTNLLLISDGLDNCSGNPCATARKLKAQSDNLTIHVVAFDNKLQKSLKTLSCMAKETDGTFSPATQESQLLQAVTAVVDKVLKPPLPAIAQAPVAVAPPPIAVQPAAPPTVTQQVPVPLPPRIARQSIETAPPVVPQAAKGAKGDAPATPPAKGLTPVSLTARLTDSSDPIDAGLIWRIFDAKANGEGKYNLLSTYRTGQLTEALSPGEYMVNAAYGLAHLTKTIQVQAGQSYEDIFVLNAGGLRLGAILTTGSVLPPNSVRYDIFAGEADQFGNRKKILGDAKPGLVIRLNAGAYHIVSVYGDANAVVRADVAVESGRLTDATINHSAAKVTFRLVLKPGGEALADTQWNVLTLGGDVVKESAGALPTHILEAGSYSVLARHDGKNYTHQFEVKPGEPAQVEVLIR